MAVLKTTVVEFLFRYKLYATTITLINIDNIDNIEEKQHASKI